MSMAESQPVYSGIRLLVVMGSSGCGKSTTGRALSQRLNAVFIEGDDHHSPENRAKMASGVALTDADRWPWLKAMAMAMSNSEGRVVASCSALKKAYRQYITECANEPVLFVYLHGTKELLTTRIAARENHFMSKSLLDSQLATLETPTANELSITIDIDQPVGSLVDDIIKSIHC